MLRTLREIIPFWQDFRICKSPSSPGRRPAGNPFSFRAFPFVSLAIEACRFEKLE
jgi:hypothetical protein